MFVWVVITIFIRFFYQSARISENEHVAHSVTEDVSDYWMICSLFSRHFADLSPFVANDIVMKTIMASSATAVAALSSIVAVFNSTFRTQQGSR